MTPGCRHVGSATTLTVSQALEATDSIVGQSRHVVCVDRPLPAEAGSSMECRIESKSDGLRTVMTISGRLSGASVAELRRVRLATAGSITVDLSSLVSADDDGIAAIRALSLAGDEIRSASPFVELLLADDPPG